MSMNLTQTVKSLALEMGFDQVGITKLNVFEKGEAQLEKWLKEGRHGEMQYLEDFKARREQFLKEIPDAKSVIVLGINYYSKNPREEKTKGVPLSGAVARYAWGQDYHYVIRKKHEEFIEALQSQGHEKFSARSCVDTKPLLERTAAVQSGFGFAGKNTMLLSQKFGPWLFLSEIVTSLDLEEDDAFEGDCGTCVKCQKVCPTGALDEDYKIDARLCISYLTIEHKGVIPRELRSQMKDWIFGCDECLTICPFTSKEKTTKWEAFQPERGVGPEIDFDELFSLKSNGDYEKRFAGTAVLRARRKQLLRNACIVLGNSGKKEALSYLEKALEDSAWLVRLHAVWALGVLPFEECSTYLKNQNSKETHTEVLDEIAWALSQK